MAKTVLDKYLETQNTRQLSPEELVANFRKEIDDYDKRMTYCGKIKDLSFVPSFQIVCEDLSGGYELPF